METQSRQQTSGMGLSNSSTELPLSELADDCDVVLNCSFHKLNSTNGRTIEILQDTRARFRLWAENIGALQREKYSTSLGFRLRESSLMRQSATSILCDLRSCLIKLDKVLSGDQPNTHQCDYYCPTVRSKFTFQAQHDKTEPGLFLEEGNSQYDLSDLGDLLTAADSFVNQLFRLSILIRRQRPRGRQQNPLSFIPHIASPDITHISDKFPKVKSTPWLSERLGNAITRRRDYIHYRQHHRKSLATRGVDAADDDGEAGTIATSYREEDGEVETSSLEIKRRRDSAASAVTSLFTAFEDENGRNIPDLPDMTLDGVRLRYKEEFECPYCRTVTVASNRLEWKAHVFADLEPYVCTYKDCLAPMFSTRVEWFKHETAVHRRQWRCILCHKPEFESESGLKEHLKSAHSGVSSDDQISLVVGGGQIDARYFEETACPLCDMWDPKSLSNTHENWREFRRHLGRHMQQLALEALPLSIDGLEIEGTDRPRVNHLDASGEREVLYCLACANEWYRDEHGLNCPECQTDITEIIDPENDPRAFERISNSSLSSDSPINL